MIYIIIIFSVENISAYSSAGQFNLGSPPNKLVIIVSCLHHLASFSHLAITEITTEYCYLNNTFCDDSAEALGFCFAKKCFFLLVFCGIFAVGNRTCYWDMLIVVINFITYHHGIMYLWKTNNEAIFKSKTSRMSGDGLVKIFIIWNKSTCKFLF